MGESNIPEMEIGDEALHLWGFFLMFVVYLKIGSKL